MRIVNRPQRQFGQVDIADIQFDARSRDDIPAILKGLQYIYVNDPIREKVFTCLEKTITSKINRNTGRPGMLLWNILVLATVKLAINCDFDRLQDLANNHLVLRQMLGHSGWEDPQRYALQTLIDNVSLLKPEVLMDINQMVVEAGHELLKKKPSEPLKTRCDSFVVETDVHYPTDINLLWDAMRRLIEISGRAGQQHGIKGWRQFRFNLKQLKKKCRKIQNARYSNSKDEAKKQAKKDVVHQLYRDYLLLAKQLIEKSERTLIALAQQGETFAILQMNHYMMHAQRQIDQIDRRVLNDEVIPHGEKVFSIFEPHTEWISKGKAGVPVELGVRVSVLEDQYQFILHHRIMWKETDDKVAVPIIEEALRRFPMINQCSYDKGYYSKDNVIVLNECLDNVILPKKGRCNKDEQAWENSEPFRQARRQHSAVESCINNLEVRGLDRCLSYGVDGFERHVGLAIVATNIHRMGLILQRQEREKLKKEKRHTQRQLIAA